jgi:dienelactone hydrolase
MKSEHPWDIRRGGGSTRWRRVLVLILTLAALFVGAGTPLLGAHRRAADVLRRFAEQAPTRFATPDRGIDEIEEKFEPSQALAPGGETTARLRWYVPRGGENGKGGTPGLVLVHGIHRLAVDEPRLVRFARALAANGVTVLTPEVRELADYQVDPRSIETIGAAAHMLRMKLSRKVGVMGMSFAGGLSLLAACDRRFEADIGMVVAVGAHDDASRVARFFATSTIARPNGETASLEAHGYGVLVFAYAHADRFFPEEDRAIARQALSSWLAGDRDAARAAAGRSSDASRELLAALFDRRLDRVLQPFLAAIEADAPALQAISPHGRLDHLHVPIFLLHGAGDSVIPPPETEWLARDVPSGVLRDVLISRALVHVEPGGQPTWYEQWELLHFVADVLAELDRARR